MSIQVFWWDFDVNCESFWLKYFKQYQEDRRLIKALGICPTILWIALPIAISLLLLQKEVL